VAAYDILAVRPNNEKVFLAACSSFDVDIISLDFSSRLPFYLKHTTLGLAISRGIHFEICYSGVLRGITQFVWGIFFWNLHRRSFFGFLNWIFFFLTFFKNIRFFVSSTFFF